MQKSLLLFLCILFFHHFSAPIGRAQAIPDRSEVSTGASAAGQSSPVMIQFGRVDTSGISSLLDGMTESGAGLWNSNLFSDWAQHQFESFDASLDTGRDTAVFELSSKGVYLHHHRHSFLITELENPRQVEYLEPFTMMDFNRVDGFFLGLGSSRMVDLGPHDEFGMDGGGGYGFANHAWQYTFGMEYRLPLSSEPARQVREDTVFEHVFSVPPTLAIGAEIHNETSTDDAWRENRTENALDGFFAREDFREYYKQAGYSAYLAFRLDPRDELRLEWRADDYENRDQEVFHGRWGGNKVLPPNYPITQGNLHSLVVTGQSERARAKTYRFANAYGDTVQVEQMKGSSELVQFEMGHMPGADHGFNRFVVDLRWFTPITRFISLDLRLRGQNISGDTVLQKMAYIGGPGSLPALLNRSVAGTGLELLNTELRLYPVALSRVFGSDLSLIVLNDFGHIVNENNPFKTSSIIYNIGGAIGYTQGIQLGVSFRTDIKATGRAIIRIERTF